MDSNAQMITIAIINFATNSINAVQLIYNAQIMTLAIIVMDYLVTKIQIVFPTFVTNKTIKVSVLALSSNLLYKHGTSFWCV